MRNTEGLTPAERELQEALGRLKLTDVSMDYEQLVFRAGRQSMRRGMQLWRGFSVILLVGLGLSLATHPFQHRDKPSAYVKIESDSPTKIWSEGVMAVPRVRITALRLDENSYIRLRQRVLAKKLDDLFFDLPLQEQRFDQIDINDLKDWRNQL